MWTITFFVGVKSRTYRSTMRIWEAVGVGVIVIINQPLVWFLEIRKKQEPKFCIEWKCFLIILTCNGWIMENNIQRSHSQPRKWKKIFNWLQKLGKFQPKCRWRQKIFFFNFCFSLVFFSNLKKSNKLLIHNYHESKLKPSFRS